MHCIEATSDIASRSRRRALLLASTALASDFLGVAAAGEIELLRAAPRDQSALRSDLYIRLLARLWLQ